MRKLGILSIMAAVVVLCMFAGVAIAKEAPGDEMRVNNELAKPSGEPRYHLLNINNLWYWCESNGESNHSRGGDSGTYYPRGMVWCIYKDGIKWSARCYTDEALTTPAPYGQTIRIGGCDYGNGTREGWVDGFGATATRVDPGDPLVRMFRVRRDYYNFSRDATGAWSSEFIRDVAEYNEIAENEVDDVLAQEVYDMYDLDWNEWPVHLGAPYIDRDGDGVYTAPPAFGPDFSVDDLIEGGYDEPGVVGADVNSPADQVLWNVYNDLDRNATLALEGSEPMGLELQRTVWGYKRTDAMGNLFFSQTLIINKGGVDVDGAGGMGTFYFDSMYAAIWSDPDNGSAGDDLLGCDTILSMGYVYNGNAVDREYERYGQVAPAAGYDFLAGPIVEAPGEQAVFNLKYRDGWRNLGMSSFSWFSAGSPISDPPSNYTGGLRWDKMFRGYAPIDGPDQFYPFPPGVEPNPFPLSGDPVTGTGLIDGLGETYSFAPGDRRLNMSSGPFSMAPGDTQQVVYGFVAGQGADRISSVAVMKFNDRFAQNTYDALFQVPKAPFAPSVSVAALNEKIILNWGNNIETVRKTEDIINQPGNYTFEGYNVYQFPRATSGLNEAVRITTFDIANEATVILDEQFDRTSGQVLFIPVQFGSNTGIQRHFEFDRDYVRDIDRIYNGEEYYLAVTAYSMATIDGYIPATLESAPTVLTIQPKIEFGTEYTIALGDTIAATHAAGGSDGMVYPVVIDATALTGNEYRVTFNDIGEGNTSWNLANVSTGQTLLEGEMNQAGDDQYLITEGFQARVVGAPLEFNSFQCVANGAGVIDPPESAAAPWAGFPCPTGVDPDGYVTSGQQLGEGAWMFHTGDNGTRGSYDAFKSRSMRNDNFQVAVPYDWEMRFTERGSYAYKGYEANEIVWVPFELWCIGVGTPDDPSDDYRMIPLLLEDIGGVVNLEYALDLWGDNEHSVSSADNDPFTDWVYWRKPADETPGESGYDAYAAAIDLVNMELGTTAGDHIGREVIARSVLVNWNGGSEPPFDQDLPEEGTIFRLVTTKPNTIEDVFTFTSVAPTTGADLDALSAKEVGVYPNPYYAFNPAELSRLARFVTFNNLPQQATIRIFNLAGHLVAKIEKDNASQFQRWDLLNHDGLPVASGMYIVHVTMTLPSDGSEATKILKLAVIQEQEVLDVY